MQIRKWKVYATKAPETVSWYRPHPETFVCPSYRSCCCRISRSLLPLGSANPPSLNDLLSLCPYAGPTNGEKKTTPNFNSQKPPGLVLFPPAGVFSNRY